MKKLLPLLAVLFLSGCTTAVVVPDGSVALKPISEELTSIHSRVFMTSDYKSLTQSTVSAVETLGYKPNNINSSSGVIVAVKEDSVFSVGELVGKAVIAAVFGGSPQVSDKIVNTASISVTPLVEDPETTRVFVQVRSTLLDTAGRVMRTELQGEDSPVYGELFFNISEISGIAKAGE